MRFQQVRARFAAESGVPLPSGCDQLAGHRPSTVVRQTLISDASARLGTVVDACHMAGRPIQTVDTVRQVPPTKSVLPHRRANPLPLLARHRQKVRVSCGELVALQYARPVRRIAELMSTEIAQVLGAMLLEVAFQKAGDA